MNKILFRGDAKPSIGTGDLMSLITLSQYFENDGWEAYFLIRGYEAGIKIVEGRGINNVTIIPPDCSLIEEQKAIEDLIIQLDIDVLFLEITERKLTDYRLPAGVKKVCVNFDGVISEDLDIVINWDIEGTIAFDTIRYSNIKFLLGPQYIILPINFDKNLISARTYATKPQNVLIAMGGTDELNFTQKVVDTILENAIDMKITVIIGAGYPYKKELETSLSKSEIVYIIKQNIGDMLPEYLNCDVAVGAGGLTSYELIATGTPAILIATYKHQIERCKYFDDQGWARYLGYRYYNSQLLKHLIKNPPASGDINIFNTRKIVEAVNELIK